MIMVVRPAGVGLVNLRNDGEIRDSVGDRVGAAEGDDNALSRWSMRQRDVAAGVGKKRASVPRLKSILVPNLYIIDSTIKKVLQKY